jgi:signal recognition particle receptor subunit beta
VVISDDWTNLNIPRQIEMRALNVPDLPKKGRKRVKMAEDHKAANGPPDRLTTQQMLALAWAGARIMLHRFFKQVFGSREPPPIDWLQVRALCLGLDGAGKSSLARRAFDATATLDESMQPTNGFNVRTVTVPPHFQCELWEIGGAPTMRPFWSRYAKPGLRGLVWVVDGADPSRLGESGQTLEKLLLESPNLAVLPLLVLVGKADLPSALGSAAVAEGLGLEALAKQGLIRGPRNVQSVSAVDGANLVESLRWLCEGGGRY